MIKMSHNDTLKFRAVEFLEQGKTAQQVAHQLNRSRRTIERWKADTCFQRLRVALSLEVDRETYAKARNVIDKLLDDENPRIRLKAAQTVYNHISGKWAYLMELPSEEKDKKLSRFSEAVKQAREEHRAERLQLLEDRESEDIRRYLDG